MTMRDDVVITGWGLLTPFGNDAERLLRLIEAGERAAAFAKPVPPTETFDDDSGEIAVLGIPGPEPKDIPGLRRPFPDRLTLFAFKAADDALAAAGVAVGALDPARTGLIVHSCHGPSATVERYLRTLMTAGPAQVSAITFARAVANAAVGELARRYTFRGPTTMVLGGGTLGYARDIIDAGEADLMLCVGIDTLTQNTPWYHRRSGLLDNGMVLSEAGAAVVVERRADAQARGARPLSKIVDYATVFCPEAVQRVTACTTPSFRAAMEQAVLRCGTDPARIDILVANDNGDRAVADAERHAVQDFLSTDIRVLAPKVTIGECYGASEMLGAVVASAALAAGRGEKIGMVNTVQIGGSVSSLIVEGEPA